MVENDALKTNKSISIFHDGSQTSEDGNKRNKFFCSHSIRIVQSQLNWVYCWTVFRCIALCGVVGAYLCAVADLFRLICLYSKCFRLKRRDASNGPINYNRITFHHTQKPQLFLNRVEIFWCDSHYAMIYFLTSPPHRFAYRLCVFVFASVRIHFEDKITWACSVNACTIRNFFLKMKKHLRMLYQINFVYFISTFEFFPLWK